MILNTTSKTLNSTTRVAKFRALIIPRIKIEIGRIFSIFRAWSSFQERSPDFRITSRSTKDLWTFRTAKSRAVWWRISTCLNWFILRKLALNWSVTNQSKELSALFSSVTLLTRLTNLLKSQTKLSPAKISTLAIYNKSWSMKSMEGRFSEFCSMYRTELIRKRPKAIKSLSQRLRIQAS